MHPIKLLDRFMRKVDILPGGCWEWRGVRNCKSGYGYVGIGTGDFIAHRVAYELHVGPIPIGLHIDHLCRNRGCVNPRHLEPVTQAENTRRGVGTGSQINAAKTHCKRGHEFTLENTKPQKGGRGRICRICIHAANRQYRLVA